MRQNKIQFEEQNNDLCQVHSKERVFSGGGKGINMGNSNKNYYKTYENTISHLNVNPLTADCHSLPLTRQHPVNSYPEQNNVIYNLNAQHIKNASTNTRENRYSGLKNSEKNCNRRKYKSDKRNQPRCAICVHDKLVRSNSTNTSDHFKHQKCCKLNGKTKTRLIDKFPFEIGVKKSQPNLYRQCDTLCERVVQTKDKCNEISSTKVSDAHKEVGQTNDKLPKRYSFTFIDTPESKISLLSKDENEAVTMDLDASANKNIKEKNLRLREGIHFSNLR